MHHSTRTRSAHKTKVHSPRNTLQLDVPARIARIARRLTLHLPHHWSWADSWHGLHTAVQRAWTARRDPDHPPATGATKGHQLNSRADRQLRHTPRPTSPGHRESTSGKRKESPTQQAGWIRVQEGVARVDEMCWAKAAVRSNREGGDAVPPVCRERWHDGGGRPSVALAMIARDEERCIRRALASAAPFVDEMVVLDTGSRDATIAIAQAAGARVASATWQDDFSIARNAALAMTDCDYILMLDADEWVTAGGERLRGWCRSADQLGAIEIVSSFTDDGEVRHSTSRVVRLVARGVRFIGAVHEQPDRGWPARDTGLRVEHDGYQTAQSERKRGRNERLLRAELAHAEDGYLRSQLGVDLEVQGRYAEAADAYDRALALTDPGSRWRHPLAQRLHAGE